MRLLGAFLFVCVLLLTGCGGSSGTSQAGDLSGNWQMTLQNATSSETQSGFLLQTGNTLTGGVLFSGQTISGQTTCEGVGSAVGQASGTNVTLTVTPAGQTMNLTGTVANNATSMSGSYSILASGCGQTEVGTWNAHQVNPLTGTFQATFISVDFATVFHFTGSITEGPNTGASQATLSGSMISSDAACFSAASVSGVISGTSVVLNILTPEGVALGKYSGTVTTDATQLTGTYRFSNASATGACNDFGSATFAVQTSSTT
jgi:hypothetical protein